MTAKPSSGSSSERGRAGDQRAFEELVQPLRSPIYWRMVVATGDPDDAEDITQETIVRAFMALGSFRGDARFSSWLHHVSTNCLRMHLRSARRRRSSPIDDHLREVEHAEDSAMTLGNAARPQSPDVVAEGNEMAEILSGAIEALPVAYGSILKLWVEDGLDLREIKERSGLSIPAIKSRLHRARNRIRGIVPQEFGGVEPAVA